MLGAKRREYAEDSGAIRFRNELTKGKIGEMLLGDKIGQQKGNFLRNGVPEGTTTA